MSEAATQTALAAPPPPVAAIENDPRWKQLSGLPCTVTVEVGIPRFTATNLIELEPKAVLRSDWAITANLPMKINGELIAWCEFEVLGNRLAIRLTELA